MAVGDERLERALGDVDGVNLEFATVWPYVPGSLNVFVGGHMRHPDDEDGWEETGASTFRMRDAPLRPDRVVVRYVEAEP